MTRYILKRINGMLPFAVFKVQFEMEIKSLFPLNKHITTLFPLKQHITTFTALSEKYLY